MAELPRYRTPMTDNALWTSFRGRDGDIIISTPAKCGTTWMQMLCAVLVFDSAEFDRPLTEISPWFDQLVDHHDHIVATLEAQRHRRFLKSHTPLDGLPDHPGMTYITVGRDPRDAVLSLDNAMVNMVPDQLVSAFARSGAEPPDPASLPADPRERLWLWADGDFVNDEKVFPSTLVNVLQHLRTFWDRRHEPGVALFHYDDLLADLPGQLRRLADVLAIETSDERIRELAGAATFDRMRARADELAPAVDQGLWRDNRAFFRRGGTGQWRDLLDDADVARYEARVAELVPPDLAEWAHAGWLASSTPAPAPAPARSR